VLLQPKDYCLPCLVTIWLKELIADKKMRDWDVLKKDVSIVMLSSVQICATMTGLALVLIS